MSEQNSPDLSLVSDEVDLLIVPSVEIEEEIRFFPTSLFEDSEEEDIADPQTQSASPPIMTDEKPSTKLIIDGDEIEVLSSKLQTTYGTEVLYPKALREELKRSDKLNDLFEKATKPRFTKMDLVSLTLSDEDKLADVYDIGMMIGKIKAHFVRFDMHDVMGILVFDKDGIPTSKRDLFVLYSQITEEEVARSNQWYTEYTKADFHRQNLQLTLEFLENNTTTGLWEKSLERYEEFPTYTRGGPLMFLIIMKKLQSHTEAAVQYLTNSIKAMKITSFEGENVSRVTSLIRGAYKRLSMTNKVPEDFQKTILNILQTSSVVEFNMAFQHIQREVEVVQPLLTNSNITYPKVDDMVRMAEKLYLELASTNTWTGVKSKGNQSSFVANDAKKPLSCWNCGMAGHHLKDCTKPKNQDLIQQRRKELRDATKKSREDKKTEKKHDKSVENKKGKFAPPADSENNRRNIDGKSMFWLGRQKRWVPDRKIMGNTATNVPPVVPTVPATASPPTSIVEKDRLGKELAISNVTAQINAAMQNFANSLRDY